MYKRDQANVQIRSPQYEIYIGDTSIPVENIMDINIEFDINRIGPQGFIIIRDLYGTLFNRMVFKIGQQINIKIYDGSAKEANPNQEFIFAPVLISNIEEIFEGVQDGSESKELKGALKLSFESEWRMNQDYKSHAFAPQKLNKVIKKIIDTRVNTVFVFTDEEDLVATSDDGVTPRYKHSMGDLDYIENKILPLCFTDFGACFAYVNEGGYFKLQDLNTLYGKPSLGYLVSDLEASKDLPSDSYEIVTQLSIYKHEIAQDYYKCANYKVNLFNKATNTNLNLEVPIDNSFDDTFLSPLSEDYSENLKNFGSGIKTIDHLEIDAFKGLLHNLKRHELLATCLKGTCGFHPAFSIGNTVDVNIFPPRVGTYTISLHTQKYIISKVTYFLDPSTQIPMLSLELSAPGFYIDGNKVQYSYFDPTTFVNI